MVPFRTHGLAEAASGLAPPAMPWRRSTRRPQREAAGHHPPGSTPSVIRDGIAAER